MKSNDKKYIYIVQAKKEKITCKIGIAKDLEERLKNYNSATGHSSKNAYKYLFCCEIEDAILVENDIKQEFSILREAKNKEIYFYNPALFQKYVNFIKSHKLFIKEIFIKKDEQKQIIKIIKKTTPSLSERGISKKEIMQKAQKVENDKFYTRYEDVENEIEMYEKDIWNDKVVFCNCDDAVDDDDRRSSAFSLYFLINFKELNLRKLICTHYSGGIDLFNQGTQGYIFTRDGFSEIGKKEYPMGFTGSFDDPLSLKILNEEADIICTNPPFSKSIEYWKVVIESGKKFLIISNIANVLTTSYVPYFKNKQVWAGYNSVDWYLNPKKELTSAAGHWYTNFIIKDRPKYKNLKILPLKQIPEKYKKYDDNKMLLLDNCYIPSDYKKPFAISARSILNGVLEKGYEIIQDKEYYSYIQCKKQFSRVLVQKI